MYFIKNITTNPLQQMTVFTPNGQPLFLTIYYIQQQNGWFVTQFQYQNFTLNGFRIVVSPNMLYQFSNKIPFGFGCLTTQNREPTLLEDFASGANQLFLIDEGEIETMTEFLQNGGN